MIVNPMNPLLQAKVGLDYADEICRDPSPSKVTFLPTGGLDLNICWGGRGAHFNPQQRPSEIVLEQVNGGRRKVAVRGQMRRVLHLAFPMIGPGMLGEKKKF